TEYAGGFIYEQGMLQMMPHAEGYAEIHNGSWRYVYQYKDHLGNVRLSYSDSDNNGTIDPNTEIISEKNYYPFGLQMKGFNNVVSGNANSVAERFAYNGKENNPELGLEWVDFGARNYDASLGRWMNSDPLAEKYYSHSTYNYVFNNPINLVDPDGRGVWKPDAEGNLIAEEGDNASTLATHLNITETEASDMINSQGLEKVLVFTDDTVYANQKLEVDNNMTRSIDQSSGLTKTERDNGETGPFDPVDGYICDQASMLAADGLEINPTTANENYGNPNQFFSPEGFEEVSSLSETGFGTGVAVIAGQHVVSNYGQSRDGTQYVYSKDGGFNKPEVKTMTKVLQQMQSTGMIKSTENVRINYYRKL
ncbi:MAG: RHS repeat-associated core domain-containing protein, partial [Nonlabens sp.]